MIKNRYNKKIFDAVQMLFLALFDYFGKILGLTKSKNEIMDLSITSEGSTSQETSLENTLFSFEKYIKLNNNLVLGPEFSRRPCCVYMITLNVSSNDEGGGQNENHTPVQTSPAITEIQENASDKEKERSNSSSVMKPKKSGNILSHFITSAIRKKKSSDINDNNANINENDNHGAIEVVDIPIASLSTISVKNEIQSSKSLTPKSSKSKIPVSQFKLSVNKQVSSDTKACSKSKENVPSLTNKYSENQIRKSPRSRSFFRKFMSKSNNKSTCSLATNTEISNYEDEVCIGVSNYNDSKSSKDFSANTIEAVLNTSNTFSYAASSIPLKYINCNTPMLEMTLADGLHQVLEVANRLKDSETHVVHVVTKYIQDKDFQKTLLDSVHQHSKLQIETERRVQGLANDIWLQQADISRQQERSLQDSVNSLVKQNRQLQEANEKLNRNLEKISAKGSFFNTRAGNNHVIDDLTKSNEKLQERVSAMFRQTEDLENELQKFQNSNAVLEDRTRNLHSLVQNYKGLLQRSSADHQLEIANLNQQLHTTQVIIKESVEAGDVLLEDLEALKRLSKATSCSINWGKFKYRGNSLTDLIHMGRACINELSRELTSLSNLIQLKDKDSDGLREHNSRLQENLQKSTSALDRMISEVEKYKKFEVESVDVLEKNKVLEDEVHNYKSKLQEVLQNFESKQNDLAASIAEKEKLDSLVKEKETELEEARKLTSKYETDCFTLQSQISGLNEVLSSSGAGDMAKELTESQKRISVLQSDYFQLMAEKSRFVEDLTNLKAEKDVLSQYQQMYYQYLQNQQKDLDAYNKENIMLKEELEHQKATVIALQNERVKHLEEKNVLSTIYHQFKSEVDRSEKLESTLAELDKESHWLAIVAEYNRQLGEKFRSDIEEKDKIIVKLQKSIEALNNAHTENTKDKMALCVELSEVCTVKEHLSNSLNTEVQKNMELDQSKKNYETTTVSKMQSIEEMQMVERMALRELLADYERVVLLRDQALQDQQECAEQVKNMKEILSAENENAEILRQTCKEKELKIAELDNKLAENKRLHNQVKENFEKEALRFESKLIKLNSFSDKLKRDNEKLEESIRYLQNNISKLNSDLNESRKSEIETKDLLNKEIEQQKLLLTQIRDQEMSLEAAEKRNNASTKEMENLRAMSEKLLNDYDRFLKATSEKEAVLSKDLKRSKQQVAQYSKEMEELLNIVTEKDRELVKLKEEYQVLRQKHDTSESKLLLECKEAKKQLQEELDKLQTEHDSVLKRLESVETECHQVKEKMKSTTKQRQLESSSYQQQIQELCRAYNLEKNYMLEELQSANHKYKSLSETLEHEKTSNSNVISSRIDLSEKLFKAIKTLVEEKLNSQKFEAKSQELGQEVLKLKSEREHLEEKVFILKQEVDELRQINQQLGSDKQSILGLLSESQNMNKRAQSKYEAIEERILCSVKLNKAKKEKLQKSVSEESPVEDQDRLLLLKAEIKDGHNTILQLQSEIASLEQQVTSLEFQKCELSLRLHETERSCETEQCLLMEMRKMQRVTLDTLRKMKDDGKISNIVYDKLFYLISNSETNTYYRRINRLCVK